MRLKVGFCGSGAWGITLADLIARNGHDVLLWSIEEDVLTSLESGQNHPKFPEFEVAENISYTRDIEDLIECDIIVECVTAKGFRSVCNLIKKCGDLKIPFVITSKGIEQESGLLLVEVAYEIFGVSDLIGYMSGPTLAKEVMLKHPTAAVAASPREMVMEMIVALFSNKVFHVFKNKDINGVALGGAMKNVIAIASGLAEGMEFGYNTKALIITKGLQEMRQMARVKGGDENTCFGLSGIGDLIVTGVSNLSRNFTFGMLLGQGLTSVEAKKKIGMTVEGEYTVLAAYQLGKKHGLDLPITEGMYQILYEGAEPKETFMALLENQSLLLLNE